MLLLHILGIKGWRHADELLVDGEDGFATVAKKAGGRGREQPSNYLY